MLDFTFNLNNNGFIHFIAHNQPILSFLRFLFSIIIDYLLLFSSISLCLNSVFNLAIVFLILTDLMRIFQW